MAILLGVGECRPAAGAVARRWSGGGDVVIGGARTPGVAAASRAPPGALRDAAAWRRVRAASPSSTRGRCMSFDADEHVCRCARAAAFRAWSAPRRPETVPVSRVGRRAGRRARGRSPRSDRGAARDRPVPAGRRTLLHARRVVGRVALLQRPVGFRTVLPDIPRRPGTGRPAGRTAAGVRLQLDRGHGVESFSATAALGPGSG